MSNPNNPILKKDRLVVEVKGMQHPILGQRITAMILTDKGFEILTDGGNVFLAVGANVAIHHGENYPRPHVEGDIIRQPQPEKEVLICDYCVKSPSTCGHKPLNPRNCGGKDGEMESGFVPRR